MDSCLSQNTLLWGNYMVNLKFCSLIILEDKHISFSFSLATPSPHTQSKFLLSLGGPKSTHCLKTFHYPLGPFTQAIPCLGMHACSVTSAMSDSLRPHGV